MKTSSSRIKETCEEDHARLRNGVFVFLLVSGIAMVVVSFISEINFHYIQGFMPGNVSDDIFWKAEMTEVFNSMIFLLAGSSLIILALVFKYKKR